MIVPRSVWIAPCALFLLTLAAPAEVTPRDHEKALAAIDKRYAAAPGNMEVAYAWVRAHVEARQGLTEKVSPRPLPKEIPQEWRFITDGPKWPDLSEKHSRNDLLGDCEYLEEMIANCYSYADRRGLDWRAALDALRASLVEDTGRDTFLWRLNRFMTIFGDPHSAFRETLVEPSGRLPVLFVHDGDRLLAVKSDRRGFVRDEFPYVAAIDGIKTAQWISVAAEGVPKASPQYQRRLIEAVLPRIEMLAAQSGHRIGNDCTLTLSSADGTKSAEEIVPLRRGRGFFERRGMAGGETRRIGDFGYLRLSRMDSGNVFVAMLNRRMEEFRDTMGLIIDVRGNSGGTQDAIKTLLPYFMKPEDPLKVINVAAYRLPLALPQPNPEGFLGLSGRSLHPVTSKVWSDSDRKVIESFLQRWHPQWTLPAGKFTGWHVMAISHATNSKAWPYDKPVVVLQNEACFSATDNFLGALKGHPGVTLLGTASGGGSGRMANYTLPHTNFRLTLCQMASFSAAGHPYDGHGVVPDIMLPPKPADALRGRGDSQLDAAIERLKQPAQ